MAATRRSIKPTGIAALLAAKKPVEKTERIFLSDEPIAALEAAANAVEVVEHRAELVRTELEKQAAIAGRDPADLLALHKQRVDADLAPLIERLNDARQAAADASFTITFRSIGREAYDVLLREHPPVATDPDDANAPFHTETFAPALVQASAADPELTAEQVEQIWIDWNTAEVMQLFAAALLVNTGRRTAELGKARG